MAIEIRPATVFSDVKTMVGPKRPDANVCWCLSYRIPSKENRELAGPARGERVKHVDDLAVWSVWCIRVRPGHRGEKVDLTMAYVGTRGLFEATGFAKAADTDSVLNGFPRVLMRLDLR
jgi:hypothetical protein